MLIAMAGLPATGKSTLAAALETALRAIVLNKDIVRTALFPSPVLDFSREQDDLCMTAIYGAASYILTNRPDQPVIIDGRTFVFAYQVVELMNLAQGLKRTPFMIECVCDDTIIHQRLNRDLTQGAHPAGNRTHNLYTTLKALAEPILIPRLVIDTGRLPLEDAIERCLRYLGVR